MSTSSVWILAMYFGAAVPVTGDGLTGSVYATQRICDEAQKEQTASWAKHEPKTKVEFRCERWHLFTEAEWDEP